MAISNTFTSIAPKILSNVLPVLRAKAWMTRLVSTDYQREAAEAGNAINIPKPVTLTTSAVTPAQTPPEPGNNTPETVVLNLDNWREVSFGITDKEALEIQTRQHYITPTMEAAVEALATYVNQQLWAEYTGVYGFHSDQGISGTHATPFASTVASATQANRILNEQKAPKDSRRYAAISFVTEANMLALAQFSDMEKSGDPNVKIEAEIGRKFGFGWYGDHDVPTHTAGTGAAAADLAVDNAAGYSIGDESVVIDKGVGTATLLVGDIIKFANHDQTYVVTANATPDTTGVAVSISPPLVAALVDDEGVTVTKSHEVNLAFHRDALVLAVRPVAQGATLSGEQRNEMVAFDPLTGLPLRLTYFRGHRQSAWYLDILFGVKLVRPELACRIAGAA